MSIDISIVEGEKERERDLLGLSVVGIGRSAICRVGPQDVDPKYI